MLGCTPGTSPETQTETNNAYRTHITNTNNTRNLRLPTCRLPTHILPIFLCHDPNDRNDTEPTHRPSLLNEMNHAGKRKRRRNVIASGTGRRIFCNERYPRER